MKLKNFLLSFAIVLCFTAGVASVATSCVPAGASPAPSGTIMYPFGKATVTALTATGTQDVSVNNSMTILDGVTTQQTTGTARTINLTINSQLPIGAYLLVELKADSARSTIFGTGFLSPTIVGVAAKTKSQGFIYDGTYFRPTGTAVQDN